MIAVPTWGRIPLDRKRVTSAVLALLLVLSALVVSTLPQSSSTSSSPAPAKPVLTSADQAAIRQALIEARFNFAWNGATGVADQPSAYIAANPDQGFTSYLSDGTIRIVPSDTTAPFTITPTAFGANGAVAPLPVGAAEADKSSLVFNRGVLQEWYTNTANGLEQGFTVPSAPTGGAQTLDLDLGLTTSLTPQLDVDGSSIALLDGSTQVASYGGLKVLDSTGKQLPATMSLANGVVRLSAQVAGATYPITIDPTVVMGQEFSAGTLRKPGGNNIPLNDNAEDFYGTSIAMEPTSATTGWMAIGAPGSNGNGVRNGAVYIADYRIPSDGGQLGISVMQVINPPTRGTNSGFGSSVALVNNVLYVGAPNESIPGKPAVGAVYRITPVEDFFARAFIVNATTPPATTAMNPADANRAANDHYGASLAAFGNTVVVGAPGSDIGAANAGAAYVWNTSGTPTQVTGSPYTASAPVANAAYGTSVAVDRPAGGNPDMVVVGAPTGTGNAYVSTGSPSAGYVQKAVLAGTSGLQFGAAVATDETGHQVMVGMPDVATGSTAGAVDVFTQGADPTSWSAPASLAGVTDAGARFGASLADSNGRLIVGAPTSNAIPFFGAGLDSGEAVVYLHQGNDSYSLATNGAMSSGPGRSGGRQLGASVAITPGGIALAGVPFDERTQAPTADTHGGASGTVRFFTDIAGTGTWNTDASIVYPAPTAADNALGSAVAIDGDTVAVGAPFDTRNTSSQGVIEILRRQPGGTFDMEQELFAGLGSCTGAASGTGTILALHGDDLFVGQPHDRASCGSPTLDVGTVFVWHRIGTSWALTQQIHDARATTGDHFGASITHSGSGTLAIGVPGANGARGAIDIFHGDGFGNFTQDNTLTASDGAPGDQYGAAVTYASDDANPEGTLATVAPMRAGHPRAYFYPPGFGEQAINLPGVRVNPSASTPMSLAGGFELVAFGNSIDAVGGGPATGAVTTFKQTVTVVNHVTVANTWALGQTFTSPDAAAGSQFGASVAADGTSIAVGAPAMDTNGRVEVWQQGATATRQGVEHDVPISNNLYPDSITPERYGAAVALQGNQLAVGAPDADVYSVGQIATVHGQDSHAGKVLLPVISYRQVSLLPPAADNPSADYGKAVAVDGNTIVAGDDLGTPAGGVAQQGDAAVWTRIGDTWTRLQVLSAPDGTTGDGFGFAVAVQGDTVFVGAPLQDSNIGSVYVYVRNVEGTYDLAQKLTPGNANGNESYGSSLAVDGNHLIIGAPEDALGDGSVQFSERDPRSQSWSASAPLYGPLSAALGTSVAVRGDVAIAGGPGSNGGSGLAVVFRFAAGAWTADPTIALSDFSFGGPFGGATDRGFGTAVGIDGDLAAIGAPGNGTSGVVAVGQDSGNDYSNGFNGDGDHFSQSDTVENSYGAAVALRNGLLAATYQPNDTNLRTVIEVDHVAENGNGSDGVYDHADLTLASGKDMGPLALDADGTIVTAAKNTGAPEIAVFEAIGKGGAQAPTGPSINLTLTSSPTLPSGASSIPLSALPTTLLTKNGTSTVATATVGATGVTGQGTTAGTPLSAVPLSAVPLSAVPLSATPLSAVPLSAVPLSATGGWYSVLPAEFQSRELSDIKLNEVLDLPNVKSLPLSAVDLSGTVLGSLPLSAVMLGAVPLSAVDFRQDGHALADWCAYVATTGHSCQADFNVDPSDTTGANHPNNSKVTLTTLALDGVPLSAVPLSAVPLSAVDLSSVPLSAVPLSAVPLSAVPLSATQLKGSPLSATPLSAVNIAGSPLSAVPLSAVPLSAVPLSAVPLSAVTINFSPLSATPLSATSLGQIFGSGSPTAIPLSAVPLSAVPLSAVPLSATPLSAVPLSAVPLSAVPLSAVPLSATPLSATPLSATPLSAVNIAGSPLSAVPLSAVDIAGSPLSAVPLSAVPLSAVPLSAVPLSATPLSATPLSAVNIDATPLSAVLLSKLSTNDLAAIIDCTKIDCLNQGFNLSDALSLHAIKASATFGQLLPYVGGIRIGDVANAFVGHDLDYVRGIIDGLHLTLGQLSNFAGMTLGQLPEGEPGYFTTTFGQLVGSKDVVQVFKGFKISALQAAFPGLTDAIVYAMFGTDRRIGTVPNIGEMTLGDLYPYAGAAFDQTALSTMPAVLSGLSAGQLQYLGLVNIDAAARANTSLGQLHDFANMTLADIVAASGVSMADVLAALTTGAKKNITIGDVLVALLGASQYPWESLNVKDADLARYDPANRQYQYTAQIVASSLARAHATTLRVQLPSGGVYVDGSAALNGTSIPATVEAGSIVFHLPSVLPGTPYLVTFSARPPVSTGPAVAHATASFDDIAGTYTAASTSTVGENTEPNDTPATAVPAASDTLYVSEISSSTDIDLYHVNVSTPGTKLSVILSDLPADYDITLYGPPVGSLGGTPQPSTTPYQRDTSTGSDANTSVPAPANDVKLSGLPVYAVSSHTGTVDERIDTAPLQALGDYYIQVSGRDGAASNDPYALRFKVLTPQPIVCSARSLVQPSHAPMGFTNASDPTSLIVIDSERMKAQYPTDAQQAFDALTSFTATLNGTTGNTYGGVHPMVLDLAGNDGVRAAYAAADASPCNTSLVNATVTSINAAIAAARAAHPHITSVTIVGDDDIVPFARVTDNATVENEKDFANGFSDQGTALYGSLNAGNVLTDDPYATTTPRTVGDHQLYVPEIAVGRLIESPHEIAGQLTTFTGNHGKLAATTGLVTGYDFLTDGADAIDQTLAGHVTNEQSLISRTWNATDLKNHLLPAGAAPNIISLNAHFDQYRALPADQNTGHTQDDLFMASAIRSAAPNKLQGSIIFSMGCHAGLNVPDGAYTGDRQGDWAQSIAGSGGIYVANTGFGYGDTETVAYSEQLMGNFADLLDGSVTVGDALTYAKQKYFATLGVLDPYDEKASMESTFYGLPFYAVDTTPPATPPADPPPAISPDATGLDAAQITIDPNATRQTSDRGSYWSIQDGNDELVQATPNHARQPLTTVDITQPSANPNQLALDARGALITTLHSTDYSGVDPVIVRPTVDDSAVEPENQVVGDVFPAVPTAITKLLTPRGLRQQLVLIDGQFRGTNPDGSGRQRIFDDLTSTIYYATPGDGDLTAPTLNRVQLDIVNGHLSIDAHVTDPTASGSSATNIKRILVLVADGPLASAGGTASTWLPVELVRNGTADEWTGSVVVHSSSVELLAQAVDGSGNVGVAYRSFTSSTGGGTTSSPITTTINGTATAGWYHAGVTVSASAGSAPISYRLDGGPSTTYTGPVAISGDLVHHVVFSSADVADASVTVPVDTTGPVSGFDTPTNNQVLGFGTHVTAAFHCSDTASGLATTTCNATDEHGTVVHVGDDLTTSNGAHTLTIAALTDVAGNVGSPTTVSYTVAHLAAGVTTSGQGTNGWSQGPVTVVAHDGGQPMTAALDAGPTAPYVDGNSYTVTTEGSHIVHFADSLGQVADVPVKIDTSAPTIAEIGIDDQAHIALNATHTVTFSCQDAVSGIATPSSQCTATLTGNGNTTAFTSGSSVGGTAGDFVLNLTATDNAGITSQRSVSFRVVDFKVTVSGPKLVPTSPWYTGDVTVIADAGGDPVTLTIDSGAPVTLPTGGSIEVTTDGTHTVHAHTTTGDRDVTFQRDATKPTVVVTSPNDGSDFPSGGTVHIAFTCNDVTSGVPASQCTAKLDGTTVANNSNASVSFTGTHDFVVTAVDNAGNVFVDSTHHFTVSSLHVTVDQTNAGSNGWFKGSVTVTATSEGGGITYQLDGASFVALPASGVVVSADGTHTLTVKNTAGQSSTQTIKIDKTLPTIAFATPTANQVFPSGGTATLTYTCNDVTSGVPASQCLSTVDGVAVTNGAALPMAVGLHTLVVSATDNAGNSTSDSVSYRVVPPPTVGALSINGLVSLPLLTATVTAPYTSFAGAGPHTVKVDWGDGTSTTCTGASSTCTIVEPNGSGAGSVTVKHTYTSIGLFRTLKVTVSNRFGAAGSNQKTQLL